VTRKVDKDSTQIYAEVQGGGGGVRRPPRTTRQNMIKSNLCKFWSAGSFISLSTGVGFGGYDFRSRDISSRAHILWQFDPFKVSGYCMYHLP
jgi:hypothetical protein